MTHDFFSSSSSSRGETRSRFHTEKDAIQVKLSASRAGHRSMMLSLVALSCVRPCLELSPTHTDAGFESSLYCCFTPTTMEEFT